MSNAVQVTGSGVEHDDQGPSDHNQINYYLITNTGDARTRKRMYSSSELTGFPTDLLLSLALTVGAVGAVIAPVSSSVSVAIGVPFLCFVPGYTVTVALFPRELPWKTEINAADGLLPFDRLVVAVALSLALAVIVGVNLEFTQWTIRAQTVVGSLAVVTLLACSAGAMRRSKIQSAYSPGHGADSSGAPAFAGSGTNLAALMVALAVVVSLVSVAVVAGTEKRGESYTELGLLGENEDGDPVATALPSKLTVDEPTTMYYTVTNREQRDLRYTLVVRLEAVGNDGSVSTTEQLEIFSEELAADEAIQREHTVTPTFEGENLRLRYLLYTGDSPADPSGQDAYRTVHIWVDVTPTNTP